MDIEKISEYTAQKLNVEWERIRQSMSHSVLKGTALENEFIKFLRDFLPNSLQISSGIVIDNSGNESKQLDIILHDAIKTPVMFSERSIKVIPVECVYAVVEIKADINSSDVVSEIFENMKSVKDFEKTAFIPSNSSVTTVFNLYGGEWDIDPLHYFVFAIDSMNLHTIAEVLDKQNKLENRSESKRVDTICVLNRGVILNKLSDGKLDALPSINSTIFVHETKKSLFFFYRLISRYLHQAGQMPYFDFGRYTEKAVF